MCTMSWLIGFDKLRPDSSWDWKILLIIWVDIHFSPRVFVYISYIIDNKIRKHGGRWTMVRQCLLFLRVFNNVNCIALCQQQLINLICIFFSSEPSLSVCWLSCDWLFFLFLPHLLFLFISLFNIVYINKPLTATSFLDLCSSTNFPDWFDKKYEN